MLLGRNLKNLTKQVISPAPVWGYAGDYLDQSSTGGVNTYVLGMSDTGSVILFLCRTSVGFMELSTDGGATTTIIDYPGSGSGKVINGIAMSSVPMGAGGPNPGYYLMMGVPNVFASSNLYVSMDSGATWSESWDLGLSSGSWSPIAMSSDGQYIIIGNINASLGPNFLKVSNDYGATFSDTSVSAAVRCLGISSDGSHIIALPSSGTSFFLSTDSGATFNTVSGLASRTFRGVAISSDGQYMSAASSDGRFYNSSNYGSTWSDDSSMTQNWSGVRISGDGATRLAISIAATPSTNGSRLYISSDYGSTWTLKESGKYYTSAAMSSDGTKMVVASSPTTIAGNSGGHVQSSTDSGNTWTRLSFYSPTNNYKSSMSSDGAYILVGSSTGLQLSLDSGNTWVAKTGTASTSGTCVTMTPDGSKMFGNFGRMVYSVDYGVNWTTSSPLLSGGATLPSCIATNSAGSVVYVATNSGTGHVTPDDIFTTSDNGLTYTSLGIGGDRAWTGIATSASGSYITAVANGYTSGGTFHNNEQIYVSADGGVTWNAKDSARDWRAVAIASSDSSRQVAVAYGDKVYTSVDHGNTWTPRDSSRNWASVCISSDGTRMMAGTMAGARYVSYNSGLTWTAVSGATHDWTAVSMSGDGARRFSAGVTSTNGQLETATYP
jgi:hypothetical protein